MKKTLCVVALFVCMGCARGQTTEPQPQIVNRTESARTVAVVEVAAHFVTSIRVPEAVTSVAVGDPALFQAEHSDHEPQLVFVKVLTTKPAKTNLLISTARGHELCLLLVSKGEETQPGVDFLVNYKPERSFLIEPSALSVGVAETVPVQPSPLQATATGTPFPENPPLPSNPVLLGPSAASIETPVATRFNALDELLARQKRAPSPKLYGQHSATKTGSGERIRAGVSQVIDGGEDVIVLFSVINPQSHAVLLMPPQVQLGGETKQGKLIKHSRWTSAEQLPVIAYKLSTRRLGPGERADGVVVFERPPYKQSNETLFLQMAEAGAVDYPALAPIGFGVSTSQEDYHGRSNRGK
ncbi:MAG: hypothetical protein M1423_05850 [Acidobacteria bacterium]|nr:hypothetical protein [Acidobacteriota bacterium]